MTTMRPPFQLTLDLPILAGVKPRVRPCERSKWPRRCPNPKARHPRVLNPPNRRGTDPYARWCGRGGVVRRAPIPIEGHPPPCDAGGRRGPRSRFRFPLSIQAREAEVGSPSKSVTAFPSIIAMPLIGEAVVQTHPAKTAKPTTTQPAEPVVVGLDGGYVRSRHRQEERHFEVVAGKV